MKDTSVRLDHLDPVPALAVVRQVNFSFAGDRVVFHQLIFDDRDSFSDIPVMAVSSSDTLETVYQGHRELQLSLVK